MKKILINVLVAKVKATGEVLYAEGIEDGYCSRQVIVPMKYITEKDFAQHPYFTSNESTKNVNMGENEAKDIRSTELIEISIVAIDVADKFLVK